MVKQPTIETLAVPNSRAQKAFLSLGSNVGDREGTLAKARFRLSSTKDITIKRASRILDNPPLLYTDQADFLNQVIEIETSLDPQALLKNLKTIEDDLGRIPRFRYGPREIDLDILSYARLRCQEPDLILPHPALGSRPYLKALLADLKTSPEKLLY